MSSSRRPTLRSRSTAWSSPDIAKVATIGFITGTPTETMVRKVGLYESNFNYAQSLLNYKASATSTCACLPQRMVAEVADGTADVSVHFAPEVARYVKQDGRLKMTLIPDDNVRRMARKFRTISTNRWAFVSTTRISCSGSAAISKAQPAFDKILTDEGIPVWLWIRKRSRGASIELELGPEFE